MGKDSTKGLRAGDLVDDSRDLGSMAHFKEWDEGFATLSSEI